MKISSLSGPVTQNVVLECFVLMKLNSEFSDTNLPFTMPIGGGLNHACM